MNRKLGHNYFHNYSSSKMIDATEANTSSEDETNDRKLIRIDISLLLLGKFILNDANLLV